MRALSLQFDSVEGIPFARIAEQIAGRQKAKPKLPQYYATEGIVYPPAVNLQQSSSERTAKFKADLLTTVGLSRYQLCADLTGGFGVDSFYLSGLFDNLHFAEPDTGLLRLARHNHERLGRRNIIYYNTDAASFLASTDIQFDLVYIDPSRRAGGKDKTIELTSYAPDVRTLTAFIPHRARHLLIKASPMLDIQRGIRVLPDVSRVTVVSVNNEVRELLFFCDPGHSGEPLLEAVDLIKEKRSGFIFSRSEEKDAAVVYASPLKYLYEPAASILKAGAFKLVAFRFGLHKLHPNTHVYTSDKLVEDFPGRVFEIKAVAGRMSPEFRGFFADGKANVIVRNYPLSSDQLRAKAGLLDGGNDYLIGLGTGIGKVIVAATRLF